MGIVQKVMIIMLCMNLFLFFYIPEDWTVSQDTLLSKFVTISDTSISFEGSEVGDTLPTTTNEQVAIVGSGTLSLIDSFGMAWGIIRFILTLVFAPLILAIIIPGLPIIVTTFIVVPNIAILIFGTMSFIRGYDW